MGTTEEVWKRLLETVEELGVIKARVKKLEKENTELEARWTNLNRDVIRSAKMKAERFHEWKTLTEKVHLVVEYDPFLFTATSEHDFIEQLVSDIYRQLREEVQRRNREKKPT